MDQPPPGRAKLMLILWPLTGFFVIISFGIGLVAMAAFDSQSEGVPAASATEAGAAQAIDVQLGDLFIKPNQLEAEAGTLRFQVSNATEPGTWAFHCHILNHAESENGMFGMVTAMVVQ